MAFAVALCGVEAPAGSGVVGLPAPEADDFFDSAASTLAGPSTEPVLVVHDGSRRAQVRTTSLRGLISPERIVAMELDLPPTARAAVAGWLAQFGKSDLELATLVHALPQLLSLVHSFGVTRSVARLDLPSVRLRHHARSLLPGARFLVMVSPETSVRSGLPEQIDMSGVPGPVDVVLSGAPQLVESVVARTSLPEVRSRVDMTADPQSRRWWGSRPLAEATILPGTVDQLVAELSAWQPRSCKVCGRAVGEICPFCGCLSVVEVV